MASGPSLKISLLVGIEQDAGFPEVDCDAWVAPETAKQMINPAQAALLTELVTRI